MNNKKQPSAPISALSKNNIALRRYLKVSTGIVISIIGLFLMALKPDEPHIVKKEAYTGTTFYFSSSTGNDDTRFNDGSEAKPWKTFQSHHTINAGNTYLFKRGDTFNFPINYLDNSSPVKTIIGAYGTGPKPIFSLYQKIDSAQWTFFNTNIWRVDMHDTSKYTGFKPNNPNLNVGFINVDGVIKGAKFNSIAGLTTPWDFYCDSPYLYVYAKNKPSKLSCSIQIAVNFNIISVHNNVEIRDIAVMGCGKHAFECDNSQNVTIKNVDVKDIGGSYQGGTTRLGNGVEFWAGGSNCLVDSCQFENIYDVGVTMQGPGSFNNIVFQNSTFKNNEQNFEFELAGTANTFANCKFTNNYCFNAGYGWSHNVRPAKDAGVHLLCYGDIPSLNGVTVSNNTFLNAKSGYMAFNVPPVNPLFHADSNKITINANVRINSRDIKYYVKDTIAFRKQFNLEQHSKFIVN